MEDIREKASPRFLKLYGDICTEEQLYRIINYLDQGEIVAISRHKLVYKCIEYILRYDDNWIISLDRFIKNLEWNKDLIGNIGKDIDDNIDDNTIQSFLEIVISKMRTYFIVKNYRDLIEYHSKKNRVCLDILNSRFDDIPELLKIYSEDELYKFALLEYKFGISCVEARALLERYGEDIEELPTGTLKEYLQLLKEILECDNIKEIISFALENDLIKEPWKGFPNAREAEAKILNLFAELYNQTLYKPKLEDKEEKISYIASDEIQYDIDVYRIKEDFRMIIRVEGAFVKTDDRFHDKRGNIRNYKQYYNRKKIEFHGNSECYVSNEHISLPDSEFIYVGYEKIYQNQLAGASPNIESIEVNGMNTIRKGLDFSIFDANNIKLRTPSQMINNTRATGIMFSDKRKMITNFNEIFKDRIIVNEKGEVEQYKPSYIVWIEESTEEERNNPKGKENREREKKWIQTQKAASQLCVPIVIIDREYFAKREMTKIDLMRKLITGEKIDEDGYGKFVEKYKKMSKPDIIKRLFTKLENKRTEMMNKSNNYFNDIYCEELRDSIFNSIDKMEKKEAIDCLNALIEVSEKESLFDANIYYIEEIKSVIDYYKGIIEMSEKRLRRLGDKKKNRNKNGIDKKKNKDLLRLYLQQGISKNNMKKPIGDYQGDSQRNDFNTENKRKEER